MVALVAVSAAVYAIDKPYSYAVPANLEVCVGVRVIVPFGRSNRRSEAVVLELKAEDPAGLKSIERVMDPEPVLSPASLRMAAFLRERYFCTFYDAIKAMLPAGMWFARSEILELTEKAKTGFPSDQASMEQKILNAISDCGGRIELPELEKRVCQVTGEDDFQVVLQKLKKNGYLRSDLDFSKKIRDKQEQMVCLACSAEEAMDYARKRQRSAPMQAELLRLLCAVGSGSAKEICYLTGASSSTLRRLEKLGLLHFFQREVFRTALPNHVEPASPLQLNEEQQSAFHGLLEQSIREKPGAALLYGVTGSGKTAVYLSLIRRMLEQGKGTIFMVPEIALTPQLIRLLMAHFGETVAVLHSALRVSERYDEWKRIRQGKARVIIGTRSAVFAPVEQLGLLILDEEQEHSYKSENTPRYHAREVALYRGSKEGALVLLGSATPSVETMYYARTGIYQLYRLSGRYNGTKLPAVQIVDMKQEIRSGNASGISRPLLQALEANRDAKHQSILFLNRRGAGRCMICVECGKVPSCPRCSVSLTYHRANGRRMCHYCGYSEPAETRCTACGGAMKVLGTGTQKIEQELQELLPGIGVLRMDADTISASNNHEAILERFEKEQIPVLLGTQMVTKGLNFDNVTLVGVVDADLSLYVDHFRAAETTFSMLTQVVGRAGRGTHPGMAMIQTMTPEHAVIRLAANQDYDSFFDLELRIRRLHRCPPFCDLFTVVFFGRIEDQTFFAAKEFRRQLETALHEQVFSEQQMAVLGPSPAAVAKINNTYRFRLTLQCRNSRSIRLLLSRLLKDFAKEKRNRGINAYADINAYE